MTALVAKLLTALVVEAAVEGMEMVVVVEWVVGERVPDEEV